MDIKSIIGMLETGVSYVQDLSPVVAALGGPTAVEATKVVEAVTSIASNVVDRVNDGKIVASSEDVAQIKGMIATLGAENDKLAEQIEAS